MKTVSEVLDSLHLVRCYNLRQLYINRFGIELQDFADLGRGRQQLLFATSGGRLQRCAR